jgi:hypothetical protein
MPYVWDPDGPDNGLGYVDASDVTGLPNYGTFKQSDKTITFMAPTDALGTMYTVSVYTTDGFNKTGPYVMEILISDSSQPYFSG